MQKAQNSTVLRALTLVALVLLAAAVLTLTNPHYDLGDDTVLVRSFAGCVGGVPESFNIFTHALLTGALHGLSVLMPGVAWFSVYQVVLLMLSAFCVIGGVLRVAARVTGSPVIGLLAALLLFCALYFEFMTSINATITAAIAGCAALWCLVAGNQPGTVARALRGAMPSLLLLTLGYLLRPLAVLPAVCFWVGTLLCRFLLAEGEKPAPVKSLMQRAAPYFTVLATAALVGAALFAAQSVSNARSGEQAYIDWQNATTAAVDYFKISDADEATLARIGWSENERQMALDWYFMDANMDTQAFTVLGDLPKPTSLGKAAQLVNTLFHRYRNTLKAALLLATLCGGAFVFALLRKKRNVWAALAPIGCFGVAVALLLYLAYQGRLPMRVGMTILLPACAMAAWLWLANLQPLLQGARNPALSALSGDAQAGGAQAGNAPTRAGMPAKALIAVLILGSVLAAAYCATTVLRNVLNPMAAFSDQSRSRYTQLEAYAYKNPNLLLITTNSFGFDRQLFPDWRQGKATNVLYCWGGWNNYSQGYRKLFSQFGFQADQFSVTAFLTQPVRLVTEQPEAPAALLAYLEEQAGGPVRWNVAYQGDGFNVIAFSRQ